MQYGRTEIREYADDHVIGVGRLANSVSTTTYVTLINFDGSDTNSFSIQQVFSRQTCQCQILLMSSHVSFSSQDFDPDLFQGVAVFDSYGGAGALFDLNNISLRPWQSLMLQLV